MSAIEVSVTGPADWMETCIAELLESRLIACAQVWPIRSRYWWEEKIDSAEEVRAAMHSDIGLSSQIRERIALIHPYAVPCIIVSEILTDSLSTWHGYKTTSPHPNKRVAILSLQLRRRKGNNDRSPLLELCLSHTHDQVWQCLYGPSGHSNIRRSTTCCLL